LVKRLGRLATASEAVADVSLFSIAMEISTAFLEEMYSF
jgi:hypothetical protein